MPSAQRSSIVVLLCSILFLSAGCGSHEAELATPPTNTRPLEIGKISSLEWTLNGIKNPHSGEFRSGETLSFKGIIKPAEGSSFAPGGMGKGHMFTAVFIRDAKNTEDRIMAQPAISVSVDPEGKKMEFDGSMIVPKVPGEFDFELQLLELAEHPITPGKTFYKADTIHRFRVTVE